MSDKAARYDELEMRLVFAGLTLAGQSHEWLAEQLSVPLPSLRARLYLQRPAPEGELELIWSVLEKAGVRRIAGRAGQGPGVRLV